MERRQSSRHAVPAIPWALGGKHNSTVAHDVPHTHPRERRASFGEAEGAAGYEEGQVDAYLDAAVDVLLRRA